MMHMKIRYDSEADAAYIKIGKGSVDRTRKISDHILVDVDRKEKVLGIELLFISAS